MRRLAAASVLPLALLLAACGGGGGDSAPGPDPEPPVVLPDADVSPVAATNTSSALPAQWQRGPFAEIYVRGYQDSDGDGIGDLKGLTQRLDYLKELGVTGIWLMPVTQSQDKDHGYAVSDYRAIEQNYGTLADFDELLAQAHARGIGVIIDYVMNHSARQNPLFQNSSLATNGARRDWYIWSSSKPSGWNIYGNDPWYSMSTGYYFAGFWDQMPDFNLRNADVLAYHHSSMRFWLNRGVDGFRFDAVGNLVENGASKWEGQLENYPIMGDIRSMLNGYTNRYMVCEAPIDPAGFTDSCGSAFAFGHNYDIVAAARGNAAAIVKVADFFKTNDVDHATMLTNHDSFAGARLWDQLGGNPTQYKLAAATYLLQPGVPFIYYGEEIGMAGGKGLTGDWSLRTPMSWTADTAKAGFTSGTPFRAVSSNVAGQNVAAQQADANSLLAFYKTMIALRKQLPSLSAGTYENAAASGSAIRFVRKAGNETTVVAINYGNTTATLTVPGAGAGSVLKPAYPSTGASLTADGSGSVTIMVPAGAVLVYSTGV
jgi:alpha-amylase